MSKLDDWSIDAPSVRFSMDAFGDGMALEFTLSGSLKIESGNGGLKDKVCITEHRARDLQAFLNEWLGTEVEAEGNEEGLS